MRNSNCNRRSLGLGVLVIGQILCLAQADGKPNGWDNVFDRIKSEKNANGGAEKPSAVLRGVERELKGSNSGGGSGSWSKSKKSKKGSQSQGGTGEIVAVSQMSLDGMTVQECLAMGDFMSRSCTDCSIMHNKPKLCEDKPCTSGGSVFLYNEKAYDAVKGNLEYYQKQFPLKCEDFPISNNEEKMTAIKASNSISPRDYKSETMSHCIMDVMYALGINKSPSNPPCSDEHRRRLGHDETSIAEALADPYWLELDEVLWYQINRMKYGNDPAKGGGHNGTFPDDFPLPAIWTGYTINQVTQAVFDEPPCYHQSRFFHQVFAGRYGTLVQDYDVVPATGAYSEFVEGIIACYRMCIDTVHHIGEGNFALKWYFGRARPEEVLWTIYNCMENDVCDEHLPLEYVPESITKKIEEYAKEFAEKAVPVDPINDPDGPKVTPPHTSGTVTAATHFTAYRPGSPVHPSYPAMHSAASNWSFVSQIIYKATAQMVCEAIKVDYAVSKARTVAGVHFITDNIDGLNIGQEQAARFLEYYFMEMGGDINYIRQKIADKRFDWRDVKMELLPEDCTEANAADLAQAGVSSFDGSVGGMQVTNMADSAMAMSGSASVVVVEPSPQNSPDDFDLGFEGFDFNYANECAANPWGAF